MTFFEFRLYAEAHNDAWKTEMERTAWQTAAIVNVWSKKKVKMKDMLPWLKPKVSFIPGMHTEEDVRAMMRAKAKARAERETANDGS